MSKRRSRKDRYLRILKQLWPRPALPALLLSPTSLSSLVS
jgi:hypothetical protein